MGEPGALAGERFRHRRMRVPKAVYGDAATQIEILFPALVPDVATLTADECQPPLGKGDDVGVVKRLDFRTHGRDRRGSGDGEGDHA
jgi:hypothetical protein